MNMKPDPRPGVWGDDARPGEVIRILADGTRVYHLGAAFIPITGRNPRTRRLYGLE